MLTAKPNLNGVRVAILAADGVEQVELTRPREALEDAGAETEVISLRPGSIRAMNAMAPGKKIAVDRTISTANPDAYDALLLPGGHFNPDFLRQSDRVLEFVRAINLEEKPVAVICHGPWVLVSAGVVRGRELTSWPGIRDDVVNAGGIWRDEAVVRDRNWVSSRGPHDLKKFNRAMLELFAENAPFAGMEAGQGGMGLGGLLASGLAVAAIGYGLRQWQGAQEDGSAEASAHLGGGERFAGRSTADTGAYVDTGVTL